MTDLGTFSVSLTVKDLATSRTFYETLGFEVIPPSGEGDVWESYDESWVMLGHAGSGGEIKIGLFQGMFDANTLTFNPPDVRAVQRQLKAAGVALVMEADESAEGPGAAMVLDPDGNPVLLDQH